MTDHLSTTEPGTLCLSCERQTSPRGPRHGARAPFGQPRGGCGPGRGSVNAPRPIPPGPGGDRPHAGLRRDGMCYMPTQKGSGGCGAGHAIPGNRALRSSVMRVLVTGGAGFIGSHLTDALLARGDEVLVVDDLSSGRAARLDPRATSHKLSVT